MTDEMPPREALILAEYQTLREEIAMLNARWQSSQTMMLFVNAVAYLAIFVGAEVAVGFGTFGIDLRGYELPALLVLLFFNASFGGAHVLSLGHVDTIGRYISQIEAAVYRQTAPFGWERQLRGLRPSLENGGSAVLEKALRYPFLRKLAKRYVITLCVLGANLAALAYFLFFQAPGAASEM